MRGPALARRACAIAAVLALAALAPVPLEAADAPPEPPAIDCSAPMAAARLDAGLPRTASRLRADGRLRIVALGSSSTAGAGASSAAATYPARLEVELGALRPGARVEVVNAGVNGEDVPEQLARLEPDVLRHAPDLVVWQIGTNAVLRRPVDGDAYASMVRQGIARMRAAGAEVVLMDPQYAPRVLAAPGHLAMIDRLAAIGEREGAPVFRRFEVMRQWARAMRDGYLAMLDPDGLHMNDASYRCLARQLAQAIDGATAAPPGAR